MQSKDYYCDSNKDKLGRGRRNASPLVQVPGSGEEWTLGVSWDSVVSARVGGKSSNEKDTWWMAR